LGDHLRKKRLDLGLLQKEVANKIGADETSVWNWENNRAKPSLSHIPAIIQFLEYTPTLAPKEGLGGKIRVSRESLGLSQERLAHTLIIDPTTIRRWESGQTRPSKELLKKLDQFFSSFPLEAEEFG